MTILDFPTNRRARAWPRSSRPTAAASTSARRAVAPSRVGEPPSGLWLDAYEQLAACCAEVVASYKPRVYDAEWDDLLEWIHSRLVILDELKAPGAS